MSKLQSILSENWAIRADDYQRLFSILIPSIQSGRLEAVEKHLSANQVKAYAAMPYVADRWELDDATLPDDSVAVLVCEGVLYAWETYRLEQFIRQAIANAKIAGIVLFINGPGGMILRVDLLEKLIRESPKPIAAYVTGICASAHFWFASACSRIFISSSMDEVGSVGIIYSYQSFKKYLKEQGIVMEDIYPDGADLKNKATRQMEDEGKSDLIKEKLSFYHNIFSQTIARNLNIKYDPTHPLFRGDTFFADVAIANGYVHQMGTMDDAISYVLSQAVSRRANAIVK